VWFLGTKKTNNAPKFLDSDNLGLLQLTDLKILSYFIDFQINHITHVFVNMGTKTSPNRQIDAFSKLQYITDYILKHFLWINDGIAG
jgi:hypothetical protein